MLFLDRIEILGFKSFCDKTVLKIPTGITSIVGPNGCGKSNVVDALNWVLGEQSAKSLRSDKMEEVIFNGSKNRKPLNMAQVTLVWKTEQNNPAAPEVTIARRLFRSSESQYELNGEVCRLKDIHSFFLSEGFDPLAYSILEQGRIGFLIESKPSERRALIEEVAGVAEFKHKKRAAQMKLADNQIQLERIQDILVEVEKQLSSLKRQAAKARRYQILKDERTVIQKILFHRRYQQIQIEDERLKASLEQRIAEEQNAHQGLQQLELVYNDMKLRFAELESQLYQDRSELHQLEMQIQENQNSLQSRRQRIEELKRNISDREAELRRFAEDEIREEETRQSRAQEEEQLKLQIEELVRQHTQLYSEFEQRSQEAGVLEQRVQGFRKEILDLLSHASQLKNEQTRLQTQQDHLQETIRQKQEQVAATQTTMAQLDETLSTKKVVSEQILQEIGYLDQTKADIHQRCDQYKVDWDQLQEQVQTAFKHQSNLRHELQKLDAQQHSSKFYNESARSLLNQPHRNALGMMMDFIQTEPQYETAVENFLADKLNYLIVTEEDAALSSIDYLKHEGLGYCSFIIRNGHDPSIQPLPETLRQEMGVIGSLREIVTIKEEALPAVAPFMQSAVLVSNLECAQGLIHRYPEYQFVTVQGDVILSPNLFAGGAKSDDMPGLIAIQRQRKELAAELEGVDEKIHSLESQVRSIQDRLEISNRELVRVNEVRESKNKDRMMVQMELDQLEKEISREQRIIEMLSQELAQAVSEKEAVQARSDQFTQQLQQETDKREECERLFQEGEQELARVKEEQGRLQVLVQDSRIQIAECKERDRALLSEIDRLRVQIETVQRAIADSKIQIEQKQQEIQETENVCGAIEAQQLELLRGRDEQRSVIEERERRKETLFQEITAQEAGLQSARTDLDRIREERTNCEIEKTRVETQKEDLLARCQEEMGLTLESLDLPESELAQLAEEELRNKLIETENRIDRLGSINELALDEYVQMEERHRFLKTQYEDLKVSIETLLETIQRIDQTSLQRFREAFNAVQTNFLDYFQRLFNGGKCEMVLTDPENPNESGIDIHVQPPGKRLQNMMQLSGGEKALSGIAFLMSLFRYHASPFCVMDEVDAPLDESNVGRFVSLISEMKKQVQFIVVSHNKRTMEAADQLYGVTMGEPGVSSVLSAKFEEAEAFAQ